MVAADDGMEHIMVGPTRVLMLLAIAAPLAGCGQGGFARAVGLQRASPDEFAVTTRAPLSMPQDYTLVPPQPGAPRPQEPGAQLSAEAALAPSVLLSTRAGSDTPGQSALVAAAGPPARAGIRATVDAEAERANSNGSVISGLQFWKSKQPPGKVIDPAAEARRLSRLNAAEQVVAPAP